jgi:hypothetical protein
MGLRENRPRELDFDDMLYGFRVDQSVLVQTPPRTLTVNQHTFPAAENEQLSDGPIFVPLSASPLSDHNPLELALNLQADKNMSSASRHQKRLEKLLLMKTEKS